MLSLLLVVVILTIVTNLISTVGAPAINNLVRLATACLDPHGSNCSATSPPLLFYAAIVYNPAECRSRKTPPCFSSAECVHHHHRTQLTLSLPIVMEPLHPLHSLPRTIRHAESESPKIGGSTATERACRNQ
jgi:hypothetical protein